LRLFLEQQGPNYTVVTACASATHAIGEAFKMIEARDSGDSDYRWNRGSDYAHGFCGFLFHASNVLPE